MTNKQYILISLVLLLLSISNSIKANTHFTEEDFFNDIPIILSASRIPQTYINSASSITLITKKMIDAMDATSIPDILAIVPGFQSVMVYGNTPISTYHGLGDRYQRRFQVLIDNRSVYTPFFGGVIWDSLPISINDIERIEIIRGPNAAVFGSNSFSAVISITTKHSSQEKGLAFEITTGESDLSKNYFRYANSIKNTSYSLSIDNKKDNGLQNLKDSMKPTIVSTRIDSHINTHTSLLFKIGINQSDKDIGTSNPKGLPNFDPPRTTPVTNYFLQLALETKKSNDELFRVQIYQNKYDTSDHFSVPYTINTIPGTVSANYDLEMLRNDAELLYNFSPTKSTKLLFGLGIREDKINSIGFFNTSNNLKNQTSKLFSQINWQINKLISLKAGFMFENNQIAGQQQIPKLSAVFKINNSSSFRINYSEATRSPVLIESSADRRLTWIANEIPATLTDVQLLGNSLIKPEQITSLEFGYLKYFDATNSLDIKLFSEKLRDIITFKSNIISTPDEDNINAKADSFDNSEKATINGIETQWSTKINSNDHLFLQYTLLEISNLIENSKILDETPVPKNSYGVLWTKNFLINHKFNLRYIKYDSFKWTNSEVDTEIESLNISYNYKFKLKKQNAKFTVGLKDILKDNIHFQSSATNDLARTQQLLYAKFSMSML